MTDVGAGGGFWGVRNLPVGMEFDREGFYRWKHEKKIFHPGIFFLFLLGGIGGFVFAGFSPYGLLPSTKWRMIFGFSGVFVALFSLGYGLFCLLNVGKRVYLFAMNEERVIKSMAEGQVGVAEFFGHIADLIPSEHDAMMGYTSMGETLAYGGTSVPFRELTAIRKYPKKSKICLWAGRGKVELLMNREQYLFVEDFIRKYGRIG